MARASSGSENRVTESTGPNTSALIDLHIHGDVGQDRRLHEITLAVGATTAGGDRGARLSRGQREALGLVALGRGNQRREEVILLAGSHRFGFDPRLHLLDHRVMERVMDNQARARRTDLATMREDADGGAGGDGCRIGVRIDDARRLAAEFDNAGHDSLRRIRQDAASCLDRTGEDDLIDPRVIDERLARLGPIAADKIEIAGGDARSLAGHGKETHIERRKLGRLGDYGVAASKRRGDGARRNLERKVPRHDLRADAEGNKLRVVEEAAAERN